MSALLLGLVAVIVAGFGLALLDVTIRRAEVGAAAVFLSVIVQAAFVYRVPSLSWAGCGWGSPTSLAVIVLAAAVARCLRLRHLSRHQHWLIMLGVLLLVSLMLGIASHGVQSSINDSRQYLFFVGAALYMATFRPTADLYDRIGRIWLIAAALMVLLACVRWLHVFAGIDLGVPAEIYGVDTEIRVLDGPYAFFLAGPLILTVPFWRCAPPPGALGPMAGSGTAGRADRARPQDRLVGDLRRLGGTPAARTPAQAPRGRARRRRRPAHHRGVRRPGGVGGPEADLRHVGGQHGHARLAYPRMV